MPNSKPESVVSNQHDAVYDLCRDGAGTVVTPIFQSQLSGTGVCRAVVTHWLASFMDSMTLKDDAHLEACRTKLRDICGYSSQFYAIQKDFRFHLKTLNLEALCLYRNKIFFLKKKWQMTNLGESIPELCHGFYYISIGDRHAMGMRLCNDGAYFIDANTCEFHFSSIGDFGIFFNRYVQAYYPTWRNQSIRLVAMDVHSESQCTHKLNRVTGLERFWKFLRK